MEQLSFTDLEIEISLRFSQRFYDEPHLLRGVPPCTAAHPCFQKFLFQSGRFPNPDVEFLDGACLLYVVDIETGEFAFSVTTDGEYLFCREVCIRFCHN